MFKEFKEYFKEESILLLRDLDEVGGFFSIIFLRELRVFCFTFYVFMFFVVGLEEEDVLMVGFSVNSIVLAVVIICREVNVIVFVFYYRIFAVFFYSGVKNVDLVRLNRLGVSMFSNVMFCV